MKKLDALLKFENCNLPLTTRYTKEQLGKYEADLKHVVDSVEAGACCPATHELVSYFKEEYGITISEGTVRRHMCTLHVGEEIWPK